MRIILILLLLTTAPVLAQTPSDADGEVTSTDQAVDVEPGLADTRIAERIAQILDATGWYSDASVRVDDSIAFLDGTTTTTERKTWARDLAAKTTGVVAVVNRIEVEQAVELTIDPAVREVRVLKDQLLAALPSIALALLILPLAWFTARVVRRLLSWSLRGRTRSPFIADILARLQPSSRSTDADTSYRLQSQHAQSENEAQSDSRRSPQSHKAVLLRAEPCLCHQQHRPRRTAAKRPSPRNTPFEISHVRRSIVILSGARPQFMVCPITHALGRPFALAAKLLLLLAWIPCSGRLRRSMRVSALVVQPKTCELNFQY